MTDRLAPKVPGSVANAVYLARACELAYLPEQAGRPAFKESLGLDAALVQVDNTEAYVGESDDAVVVAFRGSESPDSLDGFKDWLVTNANNFLVLPEGRIGTDFAAAGIGARFHKGFMEALAEVWDPLFAATDAALRLEERPLWVTGHSLGGALALLAAWRFQQQFLNVHAVITFGAPMVGNDLAAQAFEREFPGKIFRYVDTLDIVPLLPTVSLIANTYRHCLSEEPLSKAGAASAAASVFSSLAGQASKGLLDATLVDELWSGLKARIDHHMMANYQARLAERRQGPA